MLFLGVEEHDVEDVVDLGSVWNASPSMRSAVSSSPASARFVRHASHLAGSCSSESTRPARCRTPAASQIVE
jgi:hypothetical protein